MALMQENATELGLEVAELVMAPLRRRLMALEAREGNGVTPPQLCQVSVLVVDVADSTVLLRGLDAEDGHQVLDGALRRFDAAVHEYGGRVLRYNGDGLEAVFGMPEPADDDAARAVRAGLEILRLARVHAAEVGRRFGLAAFALRAGIHTGRLTMGAGAEEANSLVGSTLHLAARLEKNAPAGSLCISHDTWRAVRASFDVLAQGPLTIQGLEAPVPSYRVQSERAPGRRETRRGIDGVPTRLVGRDRELAALQAALDAVNSSGRHGSLTVFGEVGLGKSRLRDTWVRRQAIATDGPMVLTGQARPHTQCRAFALLGDVVFRQLSMAGDEEPATVRSRLERDLQPLLRSADGDANQAASLTRVLGLAIGAASAESPHLPGLTQQPTAPRELVFRAATLWLQALAARGKIVLLVLEDLHWADDASLDLLLHWRSAALQLPLCVAAFARPGLKERRPDWHADPDRHGHLDLAPLDAASSLELVQTLLQRMHPVPPALQASLLERAAGHPYHMEELLAMLIDRGVIGPGGEGDAWTLRGDARELQFLPTSLSAVLPAR